VRHRFETGWNGSVTTPLNIDTIRTSMRHGTAMLYRLTQLLMFSLSALVWASLAVAQDSRAPWPSERFNPQKPANVAGEFDYYSLVLSWSPTYCATADRPDQMQCNRRDGRRFAFVLHGLWPQYEKGYPENCRTRRRPFVPQETIDGMLDIMPSPGLVIHEYRKHGTCTGLDPDGYYALSRRLFQQITIPEAFRNPLEMQFVTARDVQIAFARANPGLPAEAIAVACGRGNNARLREVRICFTRDGQPRACGQNENPRRLCSAAQVFVPPVRSTARDDELGGARPTPPSSRSPELPRPRLIEGPRGI
jgi:ribonuclease T2